MKNLLDTCLLIFLISSISTICSADNINFEGSSTIGKFITDAAKLYTASTIEINTDTESLGGLRCANRGSCELGGVASNITAADQKNIASFLIGHDAIAIVVNKRNKLDNLTRQQIKDLFSGKIRNWSELGGNNWPVSVYTVQDSSATRHVFKNKIMPNSDYAGTTVVAPDRRIISKVVHDWGGIGQISFAFLHNQKGIKALAIDGQSGSVNNPNYPITRPLYLVTHGQPIAKVKKFINWTLSAQGQQVINKKFVGIKK
ncbi:MAG: phosphate ABC transporter substrate-binding protein [Pseudomonadota bacterium]